MEAGRPPSAATNAATLGGMYCSRLPFPAARGYQSCMTNERGFAPLVPGSRRDRSTSSIDRVPTGYAPVGAGTTSTGSAATRCVLDVVVAAAAADATSTLTRTTPTASDTRRVTRPLRSTCGASVETLRQRGINRAAAAPIATIAAPR